jgi:ABC-type dipeptide/oligopeptide/nickel transport system permease subunit
MILTRRGFRWPVASAGCLILLIAASVGTLPWTLRWYDVQELDRAIRHAPASSPVVSVDHYTHASVGGAGSQAEDPVVRVLHQTSSWFGHDDLGRSVLFRVLPGFLVSLAIGMSAACVALVIGVLWGSVAALGGGRVDLIMMRIVDVLFGLPYILMVVLLKMALTPLLRGFFGASARSADIVILLIAIGAVSWLTLSRVVRGQVLSLKHQPFVEAARAAGAGPAHILCRHLLPNLVGPVITYATLVVPQAILQESFLSFLGIGVQPPTPSLGRLAADGVEAVNTFVGYWWLLLFPCGTLVVTLLSLNFLGDALRDVFDPKSRAVEATV